MAEPVGGFIKVSTREGSTLYVNARHVTAVEAPVECVVRLHDGSKIAVAEDPEELVRVLQLPGGRPHAGRERSRRHRRRRLPLGAIHDLRLDLGSLALGERLWGDRSRARC